MKDQNARPTSNGQATGAHDDRPILDLIALRNCGLTDDEAAAVLQGSTCVSEQELHDRWLLLAGRDNGRPGPDNGQKD